MEPVVAADLHKRYGGRSVVCGVNLQVREQEVFGLLGPNGAGKTTTLKMLLGLTRPSSGKAWLLGRRPTDPASRRELGYLPELFRFHDWLTGQELLELHGTLRGLKGAALHREVGAALEQVGLLGREREAVRRYSKGMQQRVGLAQAILGNPKVVFLDEPTSALDPLGRVRVREVIGWLKSRGAAVLLNSHLLSEVEVVCDRVAILKGGRLLECIDLRAPEAEITTVRLEVAGESPELAAALEGLGRITRREGKAWWLTLPAARIGELAPAVLRSGAALLALVPERATLEERFVQLMAASG